MVKALVLSGGAGTRLRPFSHNSPKQLVPVANKPVLLHALEAIAAAGITDVSIVVGDSGTAIAEVVGNASYLGISVEYIVQSEPRGLAHCVLLARDLLGADDFVMYLGDNIFVGGISSAASEFRRTRPAAHLVVTKVANPSQYGIADLDGAGRVTRLQEKPAHPNSDLAVTGAYFFTPEIHEAVRNIEPSGRGELEITDALQFLIERRRSVTAQLFPGYWADTGTLGDLLECNRVLLEAIVPATHGLVDHQSQISSPVIVEAGAVVRRSTIIGPAIIGAGSIIEDSRVGPFTSIGRGCRLRAAGVEYSILLDDASVFGVSALADSIIGKGGRVRRARKDAVAHRLLIGDDSHVEVSS
jgi:glucose-1-phosphate thymidylyltransferase